MNREISYLDSKSWDDSILENMRWLRENDPVHWSEPDGLWLISKFEDVATVSKDQEIFTSAEGVRPRLPNRIGLLDEGEPHHGQLRSLINRGFTPRMVKKLESTFREIIAEALDRVAKRGECDFVTDIAVPLPLILIAEMLGIHKRDRERFHRWSNDMIAADGRFDDPELVARAGAAFHEYSTYLASIIEDRRRNPRDDLVSILIGAKDDGVIGQLGDTAFADETNGEDLNLANDELIMLMVVLLVAGNETTRNALSGGMALLIENPDQRQKLIDDPTLIPSGVEEMVRMVSPVHSFGRTLTRDTELRGRKLRKGQQVLLLYPSANRDAEVFEDPDLFRVERNPHHLGFGVGSHFCLGANLARMEMRTAFEDLLRRLPDMEYSGDGPEMVPAALVRSCVHMKVRFTPES